LEAHVVQQIIDARRAASDDGRPEAVAAVHASGSLTARERVDALVDAGSFVEYGVLAGATSAAADDAAADGLVAGAAEVDGVPVVVAAYDRTVHDGTQSDRNQRKLARLVYLAVRHRWPFICFVEGDGARPGDPLPPPPIVASARGRWDVLEGLAELSGWAPTIAVVTGRALDGNAAIAMLCDLVVATTGSSLGARDHANGNVTGRPVEDHARAGNVDLVVADEVAAVDVVRRYLSFAAVAPDGRAAHEAGEPSPDYGRIGSFIPDNRRRPYDMRKVVNAFADAGSVLELAPTWATSMLTMLARLGGRPIGIFANQPNSRLAGAIDADAADKASRFVELCDAYELPLVSFIDNPGYMVGPDAERNGIARHHARPLSALHHRTVPLCSVQLRKAYGLGPSAMAGFGASRVMPDLRLAWPSVESGGMSLEGAAYLVKRKEILAAATAEEARAIRDRYADTMRDAASGLRAGRSFAFDDVILPEETRERILAVLGRLPRTFPAHKKHPIDPR
jgi:acetyl-CoA carboxylase carboxyltransferase component